MKVLVLFLAAILIGSTAIACVSAVSKTETFTINIAGSQMPVTLRVNSDGVQNSYLRIFSDGQNQTVNFVQSDLKVVGHENNMLTLTPAKMGEYDTTLMVVHVTDRVPILEKVHVIYRPGSKCGGSN